MTDSKAPGATNPERKEDREEIWNSDKSTAARTTAQDAVRHISRPLRAATHYAAEDRS